MDILITGGAGFIGSSLAENLIDENQIHILDDFNDFYNQDTKRNNIAKIAKKIILHETDIRNKKKINSIFDKNNFDIVIHLAARAGVRPSIKEPELYFSTNINGTNNLLEASKNHNIKKFILASSSSVYGINKKIPFSENDPTTRAISPYAMTKIAAEQLCSTYSYIYNIQCVCLRFFTVYGPRQRPDLAISKFINLIEKDIAITKYGNGFTGRDYTYIDDIVQGIIGAMKYDKKMFDVFNLGGSESVTLNQLIETIEKTIGKKAIIDQLPMQDGDVPLTSADISKAKEYLNYSPKTSIEEGIKKYYTWLIKQKK